jgi:hypothetical protein
MISSDKIRAEHLQRPRSSTSCTAADAGPAS